MPRSIDERFRSRPRPIQSAGKTPRWGGVDILKTATWSKVWKAGDAVSEVSEVGAGQLERGDRRNG
jgi:hypothetical protein